MTSVSQLYLVESSKDKISKHWKGEARQLDDEHTTMNEDSQILKERERDALQWVYMLRPGDRP